jgi:hypothetical protein
MAMSIKEEAVHVNDHSIAGRATIIKNDSFKYDHQTTGIKSKSRKNQGTAPHNLIDRCGPFAYTSAHE